MRPDRQIRVISSSLNYLGAAAPQNVFRSAKGLLRDTVAAGYDGLQWNMIRRTLAGFQLNHGFFGRKIAEGIVSLRQSTRGEQTWNETLHHESPINAIQTRIFMDYRDDSIDRIRRLSRRFQKQTPAQPLKPVDLYPVDRPDQRSGTELANPRRLILTAEVLQDWNIQPIGEDFVDFANRLVAEAKARGYDALSLDFFHMRDTPPEGPNHLQNWRQTLPALLATGAVEEIVVSLGRIDRMSRAGNIDTIGEARSLLGIDSQDTEIMHMLDVVRESGWQGDVLVQIPPSGLKRAIQGERRRKNLINNKTLTYWHTQITNNIQQRLGLFN